MSVFQPLSNDTYRLPRCQVLFRKQGSTKWSNLGDVEALSITPELTEIERYGKDSSTRVLRRSDVVQKDANGSMTLMQATADVRGMLFMSDPDTYVAQDSVAAGEAEFSAVEAGGIYRLDSLDVTVSAVTDGDDVDPVPFVEGTHYRVDRRTGFIEVLALPETGDGDMVVTYTAPEITSTEKRQSLGLMSNNGVRGSLFIRGQGDIGPVEEVELWDVEIRPSGDIALQGEDDYASMELSMRIYADGTQAEGYQLGRIRSIPKTALA